MSRALAIVGIGAIIALLGGCAQSRSELDAYISDVKQRPGKPLPPLPKMQEFETFEYAADELRDPFARVAADRRDEPDASASGTGPRPNRDRRKEELEGFPLDSLDMVGTMGSESDIFGLVKDPTGVVHRIKPNAHLGQNDGRVLGVYEDRIELVELFPNGLGGWEERRSAIALDDE
ncbi:MAG: pilus assembly protein PilP [Candidatus Melainabacteria bacterium]|nr:pilus assembly protein PilP [Candidatus Melainabacteria bacterium]